MFTLIKAALVTALKAGDHLEVRRGNGVEYFIDIKESEDKADLLVTVTDKGRGTSHTRRFTGHTVNSNKLRAQMWSTFYGASLYLKNETAEPTTVPVAEEPVLAKGQRFKATIATTVYGKVVAEFVVNDKVTTEAGPQVWNVMIKRAGVVGGNTHEHITKLSDVNGLLVDTIRQLTPNGVEAIPEERDEYGEYIVWCPSSDRPPRVILSSRAQAKAVAISMSERHNGTFHWCKLLGKAEQVTKRTTKITD